MFKDGQKYCALRTTNHEIFICQIEMATVQVHPISFTSPKRVSAEFCDCYLRAGLELYLFSFTKLSRCIMLHRGVHCEPEYCVWVLIEAFGSAMRCYADQHGYLWLSVDQPGLAACCLWRFGWLCEEMSRHGFRRWPPRLPAVIFRCLLTEVSEALRGPRPPKAVSEWLV